MSDTDDVKPQGVPLAIWAQRRALNPMTVWSRVKRGTLTLKFVTPVGVKRKRVIDEEYGDGDWVDHRKRTGEGSNGYRHGHTTDGDGRTAPTKTYRAWVSMWSRCTYDTTDSFRSYGARGVTVDESWKDFSRFLSDMGECPPGLSLDRINSDGNYAKDNCRWADAKTQARNRRGAVTVTYRGRILPLAEWAERTGVGYFILYDRIRRRGWEPEKALTTPDRKQLAAGVSTITISFEETPQCPETNTTPPSCGG